VASVFAEVDPPEEDRRLPRLLADHGLAGMVDVHVHLLPERMQARVWSHFDAAAPLVGREWPIRYRWPVPALLEHLRRMRVRRFPTLPYAHRPGMAADLTSWSLALAAEHPEVVPTLTFYPEPGAAGYVAAALGRGARAAKVHLQVGGFDPRDPALDQVWGLLADAGVPVVVHAGSGPVPGRFTGVEPLATVLRRFPSLVVELAHLGAPETAAFLDLVESRPRTYLDTTLAFTPFMDQMYRPSRAELSRLADLGDRIVFGSDLPSIPHTYASAVQSILALGMTTDWLRAVLHDNGARLLAEGVAP
jgi:hypothetical protein